MRIIHNLNSLKDIFLGKDISLLIGNFDGVHRGHQFLIKEFISSSTKQERCAVVMSFEPHPVLYFNKDKDHLITDYQEKYELLEKEGVEFLVVCNFDQDLQNKTSFEFVNHLVANLKCLKALYVGYDFCLGKDQKSPMEYKDNFKEIEFLKLPQFRLPDSEIVSSSRIRTRIKKGELGMGERLLGRQYRLKGKVVHGNKIGRKLETPTINVQKRTGVLAPDTGVYIVEINIDDNSFPAVLNIGLNPTVSSGSEIKIESHLLNFSGNLYDKEVEICFLKKIREEKKFDSLEDLKGQIFQDIINAKKYFKL